MAKEEKKLPPPEPEPDPKVKAKLQAKIKELEEEQKKASQEWAKTFDEECFKYEKEWKKIVEEKEKEYGFFCSEKVAQKITAKNRQDKVLSKELSEASRNKVQFLIEKMMDLNMFEMRYLALKLKERIMRGVGINPLKLNMDWPSMKMLGTLFCFARNSKKI